MVLPASKRRIVQFRARGDPAPRHQYHAAGKQGCGVFKTRGGETTRDTPAPGLRVVQFRARGRGLKLLSDPPATSTVPLDNRVAVWKSKRAVPRLPVVLHSPVFRWILQIPRWQEEGNRLYQVPPAMSTMPLESKVAV